MNYKACILSQSTGSRFSKVAHAHGVSIFRLSGKARLVQLIERSYKGTVTGSEKICVDGGDPADHHKTKMRVTFRASGWVSFGLTNTGTADRELRPEIFPRIKPKPGPLLAGVLISYRFFERSAKEI